MPEAATPEEASLWQVLLEAAQQRALAESALKTPTEGSPLWKRSAPPSPSVQVPSGVTAPASPAWQAFASGHASSKGATDPPRPELWSSGATARSGERSGDVFLSSARDVDPGIDQGPPHATSASVEHSTSTDRPAALPSDLESAMKALPTLLTKLSGQAPAAHSQQGFVQMLDSAIAQLLELQQQLHRERVQLQDVQARRQAEEEALQAVQAQYQVGHCLRCWVQEHCRYQPGVFFQGPVAAGCKVQVSMGCVPIINTNVLHP